MMSERQRKFRAAYVADISPWYNGLLHIGVMYGVGIAAIWFCLTHIKSATWEWLLVLPVFLAGNFVEWALHMYVMHRRFDVYAIRAIYDRHTRQHHQYFTDNESTIDSTREFRIVFFPWRVLSTFAVAGTLLGFLAAWIFNPNAGYIVALTMIAQYLIYESFHYCCHVHENWFVRNMPFINTIRRHHAAHHNQGIMMHYNMNLSFPIADWFLDTSDVKRGFWGTLFNGYDERYVQESLKPVIKRFQLDDSRVTLDGPQLTREEEKVVTSKGSFA